MVICRKTLPAKRRRPRRVSSTGASVASLVYPLASGPGGNGRSQSRWGLPGRRPYLNSLWVFHVF